MQREIIPYHELCAREGARLQQGMHYRIGPGHSVVLMSCRAGGVYGDSHDRQTGAIIYQGHDAPRSMNLRRPQLADQPEKTASGRLTQNGSFLKAVELFQMGLRPPEPVRVYQKLAMGVWCYHGRFRLTDAWQEHDGRRKVFRFRLEPEEPRTEIPLVPRCRTIPASVRRAVWLRDQGRCVLCGSSEDLHFDHIIPYSRGGCSWRTDNVQLLCSRHNLQKSDSL